MRGPYPQQIMAANMPSPILRRLYVAAFVIAGTVAGFLYAKHSIAISVAFMRAKYGWVCGTGLDMAFIVWTPFGALTGFAFGVATWRLAACIARRGMRPK
jgi:hypothetical protein